jgi:hypothetical protein
MIPETTGNKGFSKRALLPFVGDLSKSIFGIATENDVRVLAGHRGKSPLKYVVSVKLLSEGISTFHV